MKKRVAISPDDIPAAKAAVIPDFVFEAFNECIARTYNEGQAKIFQRDIVSKIKESPEFKAAGKPLDAAWLDVEDVYRASGWYVDYNEPANHELYPAYFVFKKRKHGACAHCTEMQK